MSWVCFYSSAPILLLVHCSQWIWVSNQHQMNRFRCKVHRSSSTVTYNFYVCHSHTCSRWEGERQNGCVYLLLAHCKIYALSLLYLAYVVFFHLLFHMRPPLFFLPPYLLFPSYSPFLSSRQSSTFPISLHIQLGSGTCSSIVSAEANQHILFNRISFIFFFFCHYLL